MMHAQALLDRMREQMAFRDGVQKVAIADILGAREFPALMDEYAAESSIEGLPPPQAKMENYGPLEWNGMLHSFAAALDGRMVGFITVLAPRLPHYNAVVAVAESFFVTAPHRKSGAGLRLLAAAEDQARDLGSPGLLVCTPIAGRLFEVLPRRGYAETNRVFFKRLGQ
jgi:GNAT superfamily N-acetyltransferase